ncbi:hypothetical protein GCM10012275_40990 [Longimycelium tulufanense]|uniref:GGDEF domain-containing protein n=1 Tax=Longimycelium tulufanense TaxID=907463 RepID=A0A8J3CAN8_9PSEU|nr:hypothetical protein [Longimycelium tulufanense]GGM66213.1 hypothetical protein GCM10012275_40990 [Longimycelium tulufanense]
MTNGSNTRRRMHGGITHPDETAALRARWRTASVAAGWPFPSDWALPAVEEVCRAVVTGADLTRPLGELGTARAESGAGLRETLLDVAALHAVGDAPGDGLVAPDPDVVPAAMLRLVALAWADVADRELSAREVEDPLTGLATPAYLRTRLRELCREARARQVPLSRSHALVSVRLDLTQASGWSRLVVMALVAEVLRAVFDAGETLCLAGPSVAVVLTPRDDRLPGRMEAVRMLLTRRLAVDPAVRPTGPVWVSRVALPDDHADACELLAEIAR